VVAEWKQHIGQFIDAALNASRLTYASIGVGLVLAFLFFKILFRAPGDFEHDVRNARDPWIIEREYWRRLFDGQDVERRWSKLKIFIWLALSGAGAWSAYHKLPELFPKFFR
jgi:hypothetical protein